MPVLLRHLALLALLLNCLSAISAASQFRLQELLQDLQITAAAHSRLQSEYDAMMLKKRLEASQASDFKSYLDSLALRIASKCESLVRQFPQVDTGDLPCSGGISAPLPPMVDIASERTAAENVEALDLALAEGLSDFDEMLLDEQDRISSRSPRARASSASSSSGGAPGGGEEGDGSADAEYEQQGADGPAPENGSRTGSLGTSGVSGSENLPERGGRNERQPDVARSGSEDDVVARQLREAAEREQDPALKEKLWEEYRRYKASVSR